MANRNSKDVVFSMFCGAGGLDEGFRQAGFLPTLAVDINPAACETYRKNHPDTKAVLELDLLKTSPATLLGGIENSHAVPRLRGVVGGPPCQAFSMANVHKRAFDRRATLSKKYAELVNALNIAYDLDFFVFENVQGLLSKKHQRRFREFLQQFRRAGFTLFECRMNAWWYGVPQDRTRIFVVGFNRKKYPAIKFKQPGTHRELPMTVSEAFLGLAEPTFFKIGTKRAAHPLHPNHWCMMPKSPKFKSNYLLNSKRSGRSFRVLRGDKPSPTVAYGHNEVSVHPSGRRRISVFEAMLLQSFPRRYRLYGTLTQQIKLISNAVPPPMARALAQSIKNSLEEYRRTADAK